MKNFNDFLCIYLGERREVHKCKYTCIYMGTHIVSLYYGTVCWMFTRSSHDPAYVFRLFTRSNLGLIPDRAWVKEGFKELQTEMLSLECCRSVCLSGSHTSVVVTHRYVSFATCALQRNATILVVVSARYFKGWIQDGAKVGRGGASLLTRSSFWPNGHSNILIYYWRHIHWNLAILVVFFGLNCLLLVIRWAIKVPLFTDILKCSKYILKSKSSDLGSS